MVTWGQIQGLYKMVLNLQLGDQKNFKCLKKQQKSVILETTIEFSE